MKIHGTEITQAQIYVCIARMKSGPFTSADIKMAAIRSGVPDGCDAIASRVADRIIQKLRKEDKIELSEPYPTWRWK